MFCGWQTAAQPLHDSLSLTAHRNVSVPHAYIAHSTAKDSAAHMASMWQSQPHRFVRLSQFNLGYRDSIVWLALPLKNEGRSGELLLEIPNPHLDELALYVIDRDRVWQVGRVTGDNHPFYSRNFTHRNFVWPLRHEQVAGTTLLLRIDKRNSALSVPVFFWEPDTFRQQNTRTLLFYGIAFGMMLLAAMYSLLAGIFLRAPIYFTYLFFVLSAILFLATGEGLSFQFLYPRQGGLNTLLRPVITGMSTIALAIFSTLFLNLKKTYPGGHRIVVIVIILFLIILASTPFLHRFYLRNSSFFVPLILTLSVVVNSVLVFSAAITHRKQRQISLFYLCAYATVIVTGMVTIMEDYGWVAPLPFNIMFLGAVVEVIVFSVALTFLVRGVYQERNDLALRISRHQRELIQSYVNGSERERQRVSRDLHDDIGSRMSHIKRLLQQQGPAQQALQEQLEKLVSDVRTMAHRLAAPPAAGGGLVPRLQALASETQAATSMACYVQSFDFPDNLSPALETEAYRIVQEAVQNIVKHAHATEAYIQLFLHEQDVTITIEDNGKGFLLDVMSTGIGLTNMRMRAESMGGRLEISSGRGKGTTIIVVIPYRQAADAGAGQNG